MTTPRNIRTIMITVLTGIMLTACSGSDQTVADVPETPSLSDNQVEAPEISQKDTTTVSVGPEALSSARSADEESLDTWYLEQVKNSGVASTNATLFDTRDEVCSLLEQGSTVENISRRMDSIHPGLNEEQKGVVIASSMVSNCQDASVSVDSSLVTSAP